MRILSAVRLLGAPCLAAIVLLSPGGLSAQEIDDYRLDLPALGGGRVRTEDLRDRVVLVDYWGTWCGPCVSAVPFLQRMYAKYKHYGFEIVGLAYERGDPDRAATKLREFAAARGLTYPLAMGTDAEQAQVPGFRAFPTMLFFGRGLAFDHMEVGFDPNGTDEIEAWIREALGLDAPDSADDSTDDSEPAEDADPADESQESADDAPESAKVVVPEGKIFEPGNGDTGFDFEIEDDQGQPLQFAGLRGHPVVLTFTSTWDQEAEATAEALQALHRDFAARGVRVLAASVEVSRESDERLAKIRAFRERHQLGYRIFPADLQLQRRVHRFSGLPTWLVFDADGQLVLRRNGQSESHVDDLRKSLEQQLEKH